MKMKKYYVIKERLPTFVLIESVDIKEAKIKAKEMYPDEHVHYVARANEADIAFVNWIEEKDAQRESEIVGTTPE